MKTVAALLLLSCCASLGAQQRCDTSSYALSSPSAGFEDHGDGTVTDRRSKLMWMHCSAGQAWSAGACVGTPARHDWQTAQDWAREINRRGDFFYRDWRMPQVHELATLAERQCENPRINLALFPGTPAAFYWTASSRRGTGRTTSAFVLSFGAEGIRDEDKREPNHVRLVRNAP